jgi:predicted DsbA family dithiol-disulfide isomerase
MLDGGDGLDEVPAAELRARRAGVQGVPFFVINGEVAISGAHPLETFIDAFDRSSPNQAQVTTRWLR